MNKVYSAFSEIHADDALKRSTVAYLLSERRKRSRTFSRPTALPLPFAAACAALVLFLGLQSYRMLLMPVSYVSIDINPSIELELNRLDRIIAVKAYNDDGMQVIDGLTMNGKLYTEGIELLLESDAMAPYLAGSGLLSVTVASQTAEEQSRLLAGVESCPAYSRNSGQSYRADMRCVQAAHESGFSFGKYAAYLVLSEYDSTVTMEDCRGMTMAELHAHIRASQGQDAAHGNSRSGQNGNAGQNGNVGQNSNTGQNSSMGQNSSAGHGNGNRWKQP